MAHPMPPMPSVEGWSSRCGRSRIDRPLPEPFRVIGHPVILAIAPFIFRPEKSGIYYPRGRRPRGYE